MKHVSFNKLTEDIPKDIIKLVSSENIDASLDGFGYICYAIKYMAEQDRGVKMMAIYSTVAKQVGRDITYSQVERAIRHAISHCSDECNSKFLCRLVMKYLGNI